MAVVVNAGQNPFLELLSRIQGFNAQPPAGVQAPPVVRPLAMPQVPAIQHSPEIANAVGNFIQSLAPKPVAAPVMEPIGLAPAPAPQGSFSRLRMPQASNHSGGADMIRFLIGMRQAAHGQGQPAVPAVPQAGGQLGIAPSMGGTAVPSGAGGASIGMGPMAMPTPGLTERRLTRPL